VKGEDRSESELREQVRRVVATIAPIKGILVEPSSRFVEDLGYDSLGIVELVLALEQELGLPEFGEEALGMGIGIELVADLEKLVVAVLCGTGSAVSR
jgi:acyl carrier protein